MDKIEYENKFCIYISIILGAMVILLLISHTAFFDRKIGYIYHPDTKIIYQVKFSPSLYLNEKWTSLNPFKSLHYSEISSSENLGSINSLKKRNIDYQKLSKSEQVESILNEIESSISNIDIDNLKFIDIDYYPRGDVSPEKLIPEYFSELEEFIDYFPVNLMATDIVVNEWDIETETNKTVLLEEALLIKHEAATKLSEKILLTSGFR
ncbi:hypothetical protein [Endozoicomonas sp. SESOKO1]|uniref:hypothetical protein n=1 Tax=Endozoicomonas sp. SESOKO1 TaxID=2828742 RepID=UPI00214912B7|nr:hypothetical protein [Endozoicomonas sp. SESOKO1]